MLQMVRQNIVVFAITLFVVNISCYILLFQVLNTLVQIRGHGDAIPWFGQIVTFPWQLRAFAIDFLPMILSVVVTVFIIATSRVEPAWRSVMMLILAIIFPYLAAFSLIVFEVWICLHSGQKGCLP